MEHPSKRRKIERNLQGLIKGFNLNKGRERSVSLRGSNNNEKPMMPKLVLPPHGAPGHPAHGNQAIDASGQGVERPHYPLEFADPKPTRVHARQIVQPSATDAAPAAHKNTEAMPPSNGPQSSKADDKSYPGQVVPPAAVAAANARNQALASQQAQDHDQGQSVDVKQLDAIPQAPAPATETHAAVSVSLQAKVLDSSSQQVVKAPSTPPPSNPSPTLESSASYFSTSLGSSPSPSPQHVSTTPAPSPTSTSNKHEFATNHNGTMSGKALFYLSHFLCTD